LTTVVWTFGAIADLEEIRSYIGTFNPRAAQNTAGRLISAGNSLVDFPDRGRPVTGTNLRELTVAYPYIIRYRVDGDEVVILRVRHGRRRP
jgi:toxin ParE1/3/4